MRTQKRARALDDEHVIDMIAKVLPVVGVPEMVLEHLVGYDCLTDNDLNAMEKWLGMTRKYDDVTRSEQTLLGGVEHSFDDNPSYVEPLFRRWMRNGELHRSSGPAIMTMGRAHGWQMYYQDGSLIGLEK
jgi:hypothetical protein